MLGNPEVSRWLGSQGSNLNGQPIYRLVWSEDSFETRFGTYNDFTSMGLFIRTVTGTRRVKKYSYIFERWILEKWHTIAPTAELPDPDGYEPFYVFEDKQGNYLAPNMKSVSFIVELSRTPVSQQNCEIEMRNLFDGRSEREIKDIEDSLDCSEVTNALHMKEAVGYTKEIK